MKRLNLLFSLLLLLLIIQTTNVSGVLWTNTTFNNSLGQENITFIPVNFTETANTGSLVLAPPWEYCSNITVDGGGRFHIKFDVEDDIAPFAKIRIRNMTKGLLEEVNDTNTDEEVSTVNTYDAGEYSFCLRHDNASDDSTTFDVQNSHRGYRFEGVSNPTDFPYFKIDIGPPYRITRYLSIPTGVSEITGAYLNLTSRFINTSQLVAYYKLDETNSDKFNESAFGLPDGIFYNIEAGAGDWTQGIIRNGIKLDGADEYGEINGTGMEGRFNMTRTGGGAFSVWLNVPQTPNNNDRIITFGNNNFHLNYQTANKLCATLTTGGGGGGTFTICSGVEPAINGWTHLIGTWNSSSIMVYANNNSGSAYDLTNIGGEIEFFNLNITVAAQQSGGPPVSTTINATIDELSIWNRTLTSEEVSNLYGNGNGNTYQLVPANVSLDIGEDLIHDWNFTSTFTQTNNRTTNLARIITSLLPSCSVVGDSCFLPFVFLSDTLGAIEYLDLDFSNEGILENSQTFNSTTYELVTEYFEINISYDKTAYSGALGILYYNETSYIGSGTDTGNDTIFTRTLTIPPINETSIIPFHWSIGLTNNSGQINFYNSTFQSQTVQPFRIDNCTGFTDLVLNLTLKDEETLAILDGNATNSSIQTEMIISSLDGSSSIQYNHTFNKINSAHVCVNLSTLGNGTWVLDSQIRYTADNYVVEFYNMQNVEMSATNTPQNIDLLPLLSADSQEFKITFKDDSFLPVEDAIVTVTRKYVGEGLFRTVESPLTNFDGEALTHLVLGDEIYTFIVSKDGEILGTFSDITPICDDLTIGKCEYAFTSFESGYDPEDWQTSNNLSYSFVFNRNTRTITTGFIVRGGASATVKMNGTLFDNRGNTTVCSSSVTSSTGFIPCIIPSSFGNATVRINLFKDDVFMTSALFSFTQTVEDIFGDTGKYTAILFGLIMFMTIPLMFVTGPIGIVIGAIIGMIMAGLLNLFTNVSAIGVTSTILWFIIAGAIIIWKISGRGDGV